MPKLPRYLTMACIVFAAVSVAESTLVFASNFDLKLTVSGAASEAQNRVRVRNGSTVPIEFQRHRVDIRIVEVSTSEFKASISIYEKTQRKWYLINTESLSFVGSYGAPSVYEWSVGEVSLNLAIVVSIADE